MRYQPLFLSAALFMSTVMSSVMAEATCQVDSPYWRNMMHSWQGACVNGKAEGKGIVKIYPSARTTTDLFIGEVKQGQPQLGVYEGKNGFIAGRFQGGQLAPENSRSQILLAFKLAADIAENCSRALIQQGNALSAQFYQNKARQLREQMD